MKTVKFIPDLHQKLTLSDIEEATLANLSDEEIDYSDIQELDDQFWENTEVILPEVNVMVKG